MANLKILKAKQYKVQDGDTLDSIAKANGTTWQQLAKFNWDTDVPDEINKYLRARVGCTKKTADGNNYQFSSSDDPGIIHIPEKSPDKSFATNTTHAVTVKPAVITVPKMAEVIVRFWPAATWKGEFGFDWLRDGGTGRPGDVNYKNIVGKYPAGQDPDAASGTAIVTVPPTQFNALSNTFSPFTIQNVKNASGAAVTNYASFLNLFPADEAGDKPHEAKIVANIEVKDGTPLQLAIESSNAQFKDYLDISVAELQKATGKQEITVKSKKASPTDIELRIVNHTNDEKGKEVKHDVGKLIVLKNAAAFRKKLKVAFVSVVTNINGTVRSTGAASLANEKTFLTKYLQQALITLDLQTVKLDLSKPPSTIKKILQKIGILDADNFNKDWVVQDGSGTNVILTYGASSSIHQYLEDAFNKANPAMADCYKVFFFDERGGYFNGSGNYIGLNGGAKEIVSKSVVLFNTHNTATTTHELLHAIGLYHTFSNSGGYTYKKNTTDNIMDYSHQASPPIDRVATWKWQWDKLQSNLP